MSVSPLSKATPHPDPPPSMMRLLVRILFLTGVAAVGIPVVYSLIREGRLDLMELLPSVVSPPVLLFGIYLSLRPVLHQRQQMLITLAHTREELRIREAHYRSVIQTMGEGIIIVNADGTFRSCNPAAERILGMSPAVFFQPPEVETDWYFIREDGSRIPREQFPIYLTLSSGEPQREFILGLRWTDGSLLWLQVNTYRIEDERAAVISFSDITSLVTNQQLYQSLFQQIHDAVLLLTPEGVILNANQRAYQMLGYEAGELIGMSRYDILTPQDYADAVEVTERLLRGEMVAPYERTFRHKDGSITPVEVSVQIISDIEGKPLYVQSIARDITQRRQQQEALRRREALYRSVINTMAEGLLIYTPDGQITACNAAAEQALGLSRDELLQRNIFDPRWRAIHQDGSPFSIDKLPVTHTLRTGEPRENVIIGVHKPDGSLSWLNVNTQPLFEETGETTVQLVVATFADVTELVNNHQTYRTLFEQTNDGVFLLTPEGIHISANRRAHEMLGYAPGELIGVSRAEIIVESEIEHSNNMSDRLLRGESFPPYERTFRHKSGKLVPTELNVQVVRDIEGKPIYIQSVVRDITRRKQREAELAEKQHFIESITELSPTMIAVHDLATWQIIYLNQTIQEFTGKTTAELILENKALASVVHPEYQADVIAYRERVRNLRDGEVANIEFRSKNARGEWRWVWARSVIMQRQPRAQVLHLGLDITERKEAELTALMVGLERARISLINNFIRDLSHEFRTPLSVINTNVYIMQRATDEARRQSAAENINTQVDLISELVDALVLLSRLESGAERNIQHLDLFEILRGVITLYEPQTAQHNITLENQLKPPLMLAGDSDLLTRAVDNLLNNAVRYTPSGGRIHITSLHTPQQIAIRIYNSGEAIPADILPHIFERFYRQDSEHSTAGLGLGLPTAKKIAELHGGSITVETDSTGNTFTLWLPLEQNAGE